MFSSSKTCKIQLKWKTNIIPVYLHSLLPNHELNLELQALTDNKDGRFCFAIVIVMIEPVNRVQLDGFSLLLCVGFEILSEIVCEIACFMNFEDRFNEILNSKSTTFDKEWFRCGLFAMVKFVLFLF